MNNTHFFTNYDNSSQIKMADYICEFLSYIRSKSVCYIHIYKKDHNKQKIDK